MVNTLHPPSEELQPTPEERRAELEKVLNSQVLHGAEILKSFLRFVVSKSLEGQEDEVKEYTIAAEVFGRKKGYDPRIDSLVRVQATRLRTKLEEYYASEGQSDRVQIALPKGHYIPAFAYLNPKPDDTEHRGMAVGAVPTGAGRPAKHANRSLRWSAGVLLPAFLGAVALSLGLLAYHYYAEANELRHATASNTSDSDFLRDISPFWGEFIKSDGPVLVTYSNPLFQGNAVDGMKYWIPLEAPITEFRPPMLSRVVNPPIVTDVYTGVGEVMGVHFLGGLFWRAGRSFRVQRSLLLTWEDLKTQQAIVLGSSAENLLLRRTPQEQEFVFTGDGTQAGPPNFFVLNRHPRPGEQERYVPAGIVPSQSAVTEDYALISMLRGVETNRKLLILAGVTTYGTQACAEYVSKPETLKQLIQHLNVSGSSTQPRLPDYFQVLLHVRINGSVPVQTSYVTHHVLR
ncbi:MAG: hypothetical protein AB1898_17370 [Acidobacteriota bacterium]